MPGARGPPLLRESRRRYLPQAMRLASKIFLATSLGMAIARSVVDLHGGRLEVDSAPGRGARVRIELPLT